MQAEKPTTKRRWAQIWPPVLVFLIYSTVAIAVTWPAVMRLSGAIPGSEGDALNHLWTFRWVKQALLDGHTPFYTAALYYPYGVSLLTHNIAWVNIAAWLPLQAIVGEPAVYSLVFLLIFPLNGLGMYLLAQDTMGSRQAAFVAGLIVAFWPYILSHHNHPNLILIAWVSLTLLYLRRLLLGGHLRDAVLTALFLALTGLTRWQLLVIAAPLLGLCLLWEFTVGRVKVNRHLVGLLLVTGASAFLLMAPLLLPVVAVQIARDDPDSLFVTETPQQTDLLAYVLPNRHHPMWGEAVDGWYDRVGANRTYTPFVGFSVLILVLIALIRRWRAARFWLIAALIYLVLALGSSLRVNGMEIILPPLAWLSNLFFIQVVRHPDRFNVMLSVPVAMLAALGVQVLIDKYSDQEKYGKSFSAIRWMPAGIVVTAVCSVLILGEYIVRYPLYPLDTPAWYRQLALEPGNFGLLDVPLGSRSFDKEYMMYQLTHSKPLVGGHVSRLPTEAYAFINSVPLLQRQLENPTNPPQLSNVSHQLGLLQEADVRYLVLHKKFLSDEDEEAWQAWMVLPPYYSDKDILVYKTAVSPPELNQIVTEVNMGGPRIGLIGTAVSPKTAVPGAWLTIDLDWGSETAVRDDYDMCLQLANTAEKLVEMCKPLTPDWPTSRWQEGEIVRQRFALQVDPFWPPGKYTVSVTLRKGKETTEAVAVNSLIVDSRERQYMPPKPRQETALLWGAVIRLAGYDVALGETLGLTLYWQARERMEPSYKVFVHVVDSSNGTLVAQTDYIPQGWTYPTNWWDADEYISDSIELPLDGLQSGNYEIVLGLYDSETGERLAVKRADGSAYANAAVPLMEFTIP